MPQDTIRTSIEIPVETYRELERLAAQQGLSVEELVSRGIDNVLMFENRPKTTRVSFPLIRSDGPKVNLTDDDLYERIEFP